MPHFGSTRVFCQFFYKIAVEPCVELTRGVPHTIFVGRNFIDFHPFHVLASLFSHVMCFTAYFVILFAMLS